MRLATLGGMLRLFEGRLVRGDESPECCCDGWCCTDYGLVAANNGKCRKLGGDFFTDYDKAVKACPCDCEIAEPTYYEEEIADPVPCDASASGGLVWDPGQSPTDTRWYGGVQAGVYDGPKLDYYKERGATFTGWLDAVTAVAREFSDLCCPGASGYDRIRFKVFALNCKKREWEEVLVNGDYENESPQPVANCQGTGTPAPIPKVPVTAVKDKKPKCKPKERNPLP